MVSKVYTISDLRRVIKESIDEFNPVKGKGVDKENKANNDKAYKESSKRTKDYDGGVRKNKKAAQYPNTFNKGMQDLQYDNKVPEAFKKNAAAQMRGYVSAEDEKAHKNEESPVEHNDISKMKERAEQFKKNRDTATMIGLTGRELDKKDVESLRDTVFESTTDRYRYKQTVFLNEEHMLSKLPDECKKENHRCIMEDANGTTYYVVWHNEKPEVLNKTKVNEEASKIKNLYEFKSQDVCTNSHIRKNENMMVGEMMNKVRKLMSESK